jgi:terephthalate 1,2-dioxygenase reductase component
MAYNIRIVGTEVHFTCEPTQDILSAALQAGIEIPYSCRKGVCANCAGEIGAGQVVCPAPGVDVAPGQHLLCQCRPASDVAIRPASWHRLDLSARKTYTVKVYRNTLAAHDVSVLQLRLPAGQRAKFRAGQYLQVALPDGSRRAYSMASPPHESDMLHVHVRHVAGGHFSALVAGLKPGDTLQVQLPFGDVELPPDSTAPLLCVAGGTGFAPVKSLLDDLVKKGTQRPLTLLWAGRDRAGLYLLAAVEKWRKAWPGFTFVPVVEDQSDAQALEAFHGRADAAVRACCPDLSGHEAYCCGSPAMVAAVRAACAECGLDSKRFFSDVFVPGPAA